MNAAPVAEWFDHPEYRELEEELFAHADDSWDDDAASMSILVEFVGHMGDEVKRLGGCLRKWCRWDDDETCDHGYLAEAIRAPVPAPVDAPVATLRELLDADMTFRDSGDPIGEKDYEAILETARAALREYDAAGDEHESDS